jgi:hypothetical protein
MVSSIWLGLEPQARFPVSGSLGLLPTAPVANGDDFDAVFEASVDFRWRDQRSIPTMLQMS